MREMKDSGLEWIGAIPATWKLSKIDSIYHLRNTKVSDRDYMPLSVTMSGIVPQLESAAKTNAHDDRKLVKKGDFAINSRSDRRGSCGISDYDGSVSLINTVLAPTEQMNPGYFDWLFHTVQFGDEFYKWGHGIVDDLWTTGWQDMRKITIPLPSVEEQEKISDFLDAKCDEIDALTADIQMQIDTLEQYKRSVITEAVTKGLNPDVEMKDSGIEWIGKIPKEWIITRFKQYIKNVSSGLSAVTNDASEDSGKYILRTSAVSSERFIESEVKAVTKEAEYRLICPAEADTVVMSRMNTSAMVGACAYIAKNYENLFIPDKLWKIKFTAELSAKYAWYLINSAPVRGWFGSISTGTSASMQNISLADFYNTCVPIPQLREQKQISDYLDAKCEDIDGAIDGKRQQLETLAEYKKSLIYEYVTGKKEVPADGEQ